MKSATNDIRERTKKQNGGKEVVMSADDFEKLINYVRQLENANDLLNEQVEEYNQKFADAQEN